MDVIKRWAPKVVVTVVFVMAAAGIASAFFAGPPDLPTATDRANAKRTAHPLSGPERDLRAPLAPPGSIAAEGIVEPADREVNVGAPVPGVISHIFVKEGQVVKAGDPLVELDDAVQKAALLAARDRLERAKKGTRPERRRALVAQARAAAARASLSKLTLHRVKLLRARKAASAEDLDRARIQARIDQADAEAAEAKADAAAHGWKLDVAVAAAEVKRAEALLDQRTIRAPSRGTVLQIIVRPGEYYNSAAGTPLLRMGDLRKIRVRLDIDELDIAKVHLGQRGYVTAAAFGQQRFPGTVVDIARRMGRKNVRSDEPTERIDTKIREVVLQLDDGHQLVQGLRVFGFLPPPSEGAGS